MNIVNNIVGDDSAFHNEYDRWEAEARKAGVTLPAEKTIKPKKPAKGKGKK